MTEGEETNTNCVWWHRKLAAYFDYCDNFDRKVEEYGFHLLKLQDSRRMEEFLGDWRTFDRLYDRDFSPKLLHYWREVRNIEGGGEGGRGGWSRLEDV